MRILPTLALLFFSLPLVAQQPDRWRGLIVDQSSPEDAIKTLGTPDSDKIDSFRVYKIDDWLTKSIREKKYRRLEFEKIEGFKKVILAFNENKLVFIELNPRKLAANALENAYGIPFQATADKFDMSLNPRNYETTSGKVRPRSFGSVYYLYSKAPTTFLLAGIGNTSLGSLLGTKSVNDDIGYPGHVLYLQIVSRTLENRDQTDILK
jgi:hypothetical protein